MDAVPARLCVTSGPDEGKAFGLSEDLTHIGRGPGNQVVLSDPAVPDHQASIARRNGRFAIYVPPGQRVHVDGSNIPVERWVWLPPTATIRLGSRTVCRFEIPPLDGTSESPPGPGTSTVTMPAAPPQPDAEAASETSDEGSSVVAGGRRRRAGGDGKRRKAAARKNVARFITDQSGDRLVQLGDDGQLPVLSLHEVREQRKSERPAERNPLILYGALACSFVLSLGMLLIEPAGVSVSSGDVVAARSALQEYYGEAHPFEPYQLALRQALVEYSQGDLAAERRQYREVLRMLNASDIRDPANLNGLTGRHTGRGRASDEQLREHLETLLSK